MKPKRGSGIHVILKEHKISDNIPAFPKEVNEVIFDILSNVCEGEAYDIVDPYTVADDDTSIDQDGRRAYFALLREYFPTSNNCCKVAESQLRDFKFSIIKSETAAHRTQFRKLIFDLGEARGSQLTKLEKWNALTDAISGDEFANLRQILNFQPEAKERDIDWPHGSWRPKNWTFAICELGRTDTAYLRVVY